MADGFKDALVKDVTERLKEIFKDGIPVHPMHTDLVPVVRCKDCRYNYANMIPSGKGCQQNVYIETADNWYCADGERMDEVE